MAIVRPFRCIRPAKEFAGRIAALPYDVYSRSEAKQEVEREPLSFLRIDRAETNFDDDVDTYDERVYKKAKELLENMIKDGYFITDNDECYYVYELVMDGRAQTGLVACASIDDYLNNVIKKHENTREDKEIDRIKHVDICNAQTGPIFLAYRSQQTINEIIDKVKKEEPLYYFTSTDGIGHHVWRIADGEKINVIQKCFDGIREIYIADGHHRAASAVKVGLKRRGDNPGYTGNEEFNFFLSVLFPHDQLMILPYNRTVADLNGYTEEEFLKKVEVNFVVTKLGKEPYTPKEKGEIGMLLNGYWYSLKAKDIIRCSNDPVKSLDVSILQDYLLEPVLGIKDPRRDKRIDFIGGIRGLKELERRTSKDMKVAFSMYPTSIEELFAVSDAGKLMPPKSTWFEPKLRSGLFIHALS
ncbi:uncharacterized protein (DUF1015 family) [Herbinix hemicellulosilytica]|uniref:DUF1015 domain-containing protein n=1 Tax=Herbinix hemicellulosilytica TaxID=1564487 RepID=A0A0H5STF5_HERHM|nr:DUF1015 family protein [Herbinix hemicellulosilytica]RBP60295.1 uncharacterized protein (DUF1015 family) [Herbinix hemicellulosilytica]CRZ33563.1 hypothetical protein HHT355_0355 [Herbinix hemicellulosilytica]